MISDAAHSMGSNFSSNIGDLLGLSEEKAQHATMEQPQLVCSSAAQQPSAQGERPAST